MITRVCATSRESSATIPIRVTDDGQQRSAVVGFMDMVGYSRLTALDEPGTLLNWRALQDKVIRPVIERCDGRIVKIGGDEVLMTFGTATSGVSCAIELQKEITAYNEQMPSNRCLMFRIGMHLGNVLVDKDDLFGNAVNIAARLQPLADPAGVVISLAVWGQIVEKLRCQFEELGAIPLKNIPDPVRAYRWYGATPGTPVSFRVPLKPPMDRPSIAVLPFANRGRKETGADFTEGLVEDIVISLANLHELFVISRASTLAYRNKDVDALQFARALGVRYVVTGSVARSDNRLRITVALCDGKTGTDLWAERIDAALGDIFDIQDNVVERVVSRIAPNIQKAELERSMRQRPESLTAYDYTLQAIDLILHLDGEGFMQARPLLNKAIDADPSFARAYAWLARWHSLRVGQGWSQNFSLDISEAVRLAAQAIELDRQNSLALATYGHLQSFLFHEYDSGLVYLERAIEACPNNPLAWGLSSISKSYIGEGAEAVRSAEHALRLSPFDPALFYYYLSLLLAHYTDGNYDEAVKWGRVAMSENPSFTASVRYLTAALAASGALAAAQDMGRTLLEREPNFTLERYESTRLPFRRKTLRESHLEHLRLASLPE